ncbi:hypothetical protein V8D89_000248 [Ganoderma adspersum]
MRLIDTKTGRFVDFVDSSTAPLYAILSHTWEQAPRREQSYQEVVKIQEKFGFSVRGTMTKTPRLSLTRSSIWDPDSGLSEKVRKACEIARRDGYRYIWVDSCCIDKTSSSELSEAINSMFNWYRDAQICYAFLADVPSDEDARAEGSKFRESRWFKRAWTLQELIAPRVVVFLSRNWEGLGTKDSLAELVEEITHIDRAILTHERALAEESVAERMRWAAEREATRLEDEAYSLLGIFGIAMPTLYGEGRHAFQRLQEEILERIPDRTLFAWGRCRPIPRMHASVNVSDPATSPFASSPRSFRQLEGKIGRLSQEDFTSLGLKAEEYIRTPHGVRAKLSLVHLEALAPNLIQPHGFPVHSWYLVLFGSQQARHGRRLLGKLCSITHTASSLAFLHVPGVVDLVLLEGKVGSAEVHDGHAKDSIVFTISLDHLAGIRMPEPMVVYLPYMTPSTPPRLPSDEHASPSTPTISLSPWARAILPSGYTISESDLRQAEHHPQLHGHYFLTLALSPLSSNVHIRYRHMLVGSTLNATGDTTVIEARIWILSASSRENGQMDTLVGHPPYTSARWFTRKGFPRPLIPKDLHLVTQSGDKVTLRLWLGPAAASRFHTHVEVVNNVPGPSRNLATWSQVPPSLGLANPVVCEPHEDLTLTLLGSVRTALEERGYSVHLERPSQNSSDPHSSPLSLILSNAGAGFTISIKYFVLLDQRRIAHSVQALVVVARGSLESSSASVVGDRYGRYQDGPHVVRWSDAVTVQWYSGLGWRWRLKRKEVVLTAPDGDSLTVHLGLHLAWKSEYYLAVDIQSGGGSCSRAGPNRSHGIQLFDGSHRKEPSLLGDPHGRIYLTFPAHSARGLRALGYEVAFKRPGEDHSGPYHLTVSDANVAIDVTYSHHLPTASGGQRLEGLTFRACVTTSTFEGPQDAATQPDGQVLEWDAWQPEIRGWYWDLPSVTLTVPSGLPLTLRLGFSLVWLSEYCITVEVISPFPLSGTRSHEPLGPFRATRSTHSISGMVDAGDDAETQEMAQSGAGDESVALADAVPLAELPGSGLGDSIDRVE